jgi:hypothetical protein
LHALPHLEAGAGIFADVDLLDADATALLEGVSDVLKSANSTALDHQHWRLDANRDPAPTGVDGALWNPE